MKKALEIKVYGLVQGVNFRYYAARLARDLLLSGYVKNLSDGTVLIYAEGTERDLRRLLSWAKKGPDFSKVERVITNWGNASNKYTNFKIIY